MSAVWIAAYSHAAALWAEAMVRAGWQGSVALALVWLVTRSWVPGAGRLPPAARCWLWRLAFLKLIAALLWAPAVNLPLLPEDFGLGTKTGPSVSAPRPEGTRNPNARRAPEIQNPNAGYPGVPTKWVDGCRAPEIQNLLALLWLLGVAGYAVRFAGQCRQTRRWREAAAPLRDEGLIAACGALCLRLGVRRAPRLLVVEGDGSPWLVGIRAPAILFPAALLARCSESEVRLMLAHELAHLQRRDLTWGWLGTVAQGSFFFHPLVWLAGGEWRLAQEMACDAIAIAVTRVPAAEYGGVLLKVAAQRPPNFRGGPVAVGVIESYHTLKRRLIAMKSFGRITPQRLGSARVALAALAVLVLIPWSVVAQQPGAVRINGELALRPDVQEHLQLSPQQRIALAQTQTQMKALRMKALHEEEGVLPREGLAEEELKARLEARRARMELVQQEQTRQIQALLSPAQLQRLRELTFQWRGPLGLADPQIADAVGLSPAHRAAIARIMASLKERESEPSRVRIHAEGNPEQREAAEKAVRGGALEKHIVEEKTLFDEAAGRIRSVLDAGELARWNALRGAPFAFVR